MELLLAVAIWTTIIVYPIIEGIREYYFYRINRAANFSRRSEDSDRKTMNVVSWILCHSFPVLLLANGNCITLILIGIALALYRWIALDGVVNLRRGLGFWYAGNSGRSFTDKILYPFPIWQRAVLKVLPLLILITLIILL